MTTPLPDSSSGQGFESNQGSEIQMNPAWNDALNIIPQALHSQVAPIFQKWDQGAQAKFDEYNTKYSGFDPFVENGVTPEILANALNLAENLQRDPRGVYDAIGTHYKFAAQVQEALEDVQEQREENPTDPRLAQLEERLGLVANILLNERKEKADFDAQAKADQEFEEALKATAEKYGDAYNEDELLIVLQGTGEVDPMKGMERLLAIKGAAANSQPPYAPTVMGSGGNVPLPLHGNKHPSQLSEDETVDVMASMLRARNAQNRG